MINSKTHGKITMKTEVTHISVIEKLLKAYYVKNINNEIPRTHDLLKIAMFANIDLSENRKDILQNITLFNIEARYEESKRDFYKKCTKEFAEKILK